MEHFLYFNEGRPWKYPGRCLYGESSFWYTFSTLIERKAAKTEIFSCFSIVFKSEGVYLHNGPESQMLLLGDERSGSDR